MLRLSPQQRIVAWRLLEGRVIPYGELIEALWGDDEGGGSEWADNSVKVIAYRLRKWFEPHGVQLSTVRGFGISLRDDQLEPAGDLLALEIAVNHKWPRADRPNVPKVPRARVGVSPAPSIFPLPSVFAERTSNIVNTNA